MALAYFGKETPLRPGIIKSHSDLTKEEWLKRMQKKSIAQGRALTWRQIKDDPELDHEQIAMKLGPYTLYENSLFCSVHGTVQSNEILTGAAERHYKAAMEVKVKNQRKPKPLIELQTPENDMTLQEPHCIIAGNLGAADSEKWLSSYKLEFIDCLHDFSKLTLRHILGGESKAYCISKATVYPDNIEFIVRRVNTLSVDACSVQRMVATVRPKAEARLFLGVTRRNANSYNEYAICDCKNTDGQTSIKVLHQRSGIA